MKPRSLALALILLAGLGWFLWPRFHPAGNAAPSSRAAGSDTVAAGPATRSTALGGALGSATEAPEGSHLADDLNAPAGDIRADLHIVADVVAAFRSNFPGDGNPVGTNAEITAALAGKNRLRLALVPPRHPAINAAGELCDRWGTPFFFHAESATRMAIRSAGPDKKMWTDDDLVLEP